MTCLSVLFSDDLFEQMLQPANLQRAWRQVRANKGAAGVDGMSIDEFPAWAKSGGWETVKSELRSGRYHPQPVRRVKIDKPGGGKRPLGIPTVVDPVIHQPKLGRKQALPAL